MPPGSGQRSQPSGCGFVILLVDYDVQESININRVGYGDCYILHTKFTWAF